MQKRRSDVAFFFFLTAEVFAQEEEAVPSAQPAEAFIRGDMVPQTPKAPGRKKKKKLLLLILKK